MQNFRFLDSPVDLIAPLIMSDEQLRKFKIQSLLSQQKAGDLEHQRGTVQVIKGDNVQRAINDGTYLQSGFTNEFSHSAELELLTKQSVLLPEGLDRIYIGFDDDTSLNDRLEATVNFLGTGAMDEHYDFYFEQLEHGANVIEVTGGVYHSALASDAAYRETGLGNFMAPSKMDISRINSPLFEGMAGAADLSRSYLDGIVNDAYINSNYDAPALMRQGALNRTALGVLSAGLSRYGTMLGSVVRTKSTASVSNRAELNLVKKESGGTLIFHENLDGHTIRKHIGKTDAQLLKRYEIDPNIKGSGTFHDFETAQRAVGDNLVANRTLVNEWLSNQEKRLQIRTTVDYDVGRVIPPGATEAVYSNNVFTVLMKDPLGYNGFRVHTSYPELLK